MSQSYGLVRVNDGDRLRLSSSVDRLLLPSNWLRLSCCRFHLSPSGFRPQFGRLA